MSLRRENKTDHRWRFQVKNALVHSYAIIIFFFFAALDAQTLRVVTINVWSGLDYKGSFKMGEYEDKAARQERYRILVEQLKDLGPDLISVNEANKLPGYARRLARDLGYDYVYHLGVAGVRIGCLGLPVNLREGDVLLAKKWLGLRGRGRRQLSGGPVGNCFAFHFSDATQIVAGRITFARVPVYVFTTHWHASPKATDLETQTRVNQYRSSKAVSETIPAGIREMIAGQEWRLGEAHKTVEFIEKVAGANPAIIMGDFNALSFSDEIGVLKRAGFVDAFSMTDSTAGYTWDELLNTNINSYYLKGAAIKQRRERVDYIFVRGMGLNVVDAAVVLDRAIDCRHPSDHFGVMAEIEIRGSE